MKSKKFKPIELYCEWKLGDNLNYIPDYTEGCWYGKAKLFEDNHFYGYSANDIKQDTGEILVTHIIIGVFKEDLGLSVIELPIDTRIAPTLFRAAPDCDGEYSGDFYDVTRKHILLTSKTGALKFSKPIFDMGGRASIEVGETELSSSESKIVDQLFNYAKFSLKDEFCNGIAKRFDTKVGIEEMLDDLKNNVYPYETGLEYPENLKRIIIKQKI